MSYAALVFFDPLNLMGRLNNHSLHNCSLLNQLVQKARGTVQSARHLSNSQHSIYCLYITQFSAVLLQALSFQWEWMQGGPFSGRSLGPGQLLDGFLAQDARCADWYSASSTLPGRGILWGSLRVNKRVQVKLVSLVRVWNTFHFNWALSASCSFCSRWRWKKSVRARALMVLPLASQRHLLMLCPTIHQLRWNIFQRRGMPQKSVIIYHPLSCFFILNRPMSCVLYRPFFIICRCQVCAVGIESAFLRQAVLYFGRVYVSL